MKIKKLEFISVRHISLFASIIFLIGSFETFGQERLSLDHLRELTMLSNPRLSPDGDQILLISRKADYEANKYINSLLLIDKASGNHRLLTHDRPQVNQPEWSPDGSMITFLAADADQRTQIFALLAEGGEAQQLTSNETGVISYHWNPGGGSIGYIYRDKAPEKQGADKHLKSFERLPPLKKV